MAGEDGIATYSVTDDKIMLYGPHSIIGRSMVCHAGVDDLGANVDDLVANHHLVLQTFGRTNR